MTDDIQTRLEQCGYDYKNGEIDQFTYSHYELICDALQRIEQLNQLNRMFMLSCEIDGFGHVRDAHFGDLTQAYQKSLNYYHD